MRGSARPHLCRAHLNEGSILAMYACVTQECQFAHVTELIRHGTYVTCTDTVQENAECRMPSLAASDGGQGRTALLDNGGRVGQRGWFSAKYAFAESSTERSRQFAALRKRSQGTVGAKRARREKIKCKRRKHAVESLHEPGINYAHFMFDSTVVVLELHGLPACAMRTYARRGVARGIMSMRSPSNYNLIINKFPRKYECRDNFSERSNFL